MLPPPLLPKEKETFDKHIDFRHNLINKKCTRNFKNLRCQICTQQSARKNFHRVLLNMNLHGVIMSLIMDMLVIFLDVFMMIMDVIVNIVNILQKEQGM